MPETNPLLEDAGIPQNTAEPEAEAPVLDASDTPDAVEGAESTDEVAEVAEVAEAEDTPAPEAEKPDDIAVRAQSLVRKESAIIHREQKIKQQERAFAQAQQAVKDLEALKGLASDPVALLEKFGVNLDAVKARIAEADSTDPTAKLAREVADMKRQQKEAADRAQRDAQEQQVQANVAKHKQELSAFVQSRSDDFELVSQFGDRAVDLVQQVIIKHLKKTEGDGAPELMPFETAAQMVEDYLDKKYVQPALKTKKVQSRFKQEPAATPAPTDKTLDNKLVPAKTVNDVDDKGKRDDETNDEFFERLLREHA